LIERARERERAIYAWAPYPAHSLCTRVLFIEINITYPVLHLFDLRRMIAGSDDRNLRSSPRFRCPWTF
jgi:hypothetical protein